MKLRIKLIQAGLNITPFTSFLVPLDRALEKYQMNCPDLLIQIQNFCLIKSKHEMKKCSNRYLLQNFHLNYSFVQL